MSSSAVPLFVDLDGTLIVGDVLRLAVRQLLLRRPWSLVGAPFWIAKGRPAFKRQVARRQATNVDSLRYRESVLRYLREEQNAGRPLIMATANDRLLVEPVYRKLGLFSHLICTDEGQNLKGPAKRDAIEAYCKEQGWTKYGYVGDHFADLPIWQSAAEAYVVCPSDSLRAAVQRLPGTRVVRILE